METVDQLLPPSTAVALPPARGPEASDMAVDL